MNKFRIPFNKPFIVGKELEYITEAIRFGHTAGDGLFSKSCHQFFEDYFHVKKALLTTSCTHALEMAAILLDVKEGDEIIVPSFTFVSTINAFVLRGARPRFADIRSDTLNIDEQHLETLINHRTKAIVPVHYGSVSCEMDVILALSQKHGLAVVEDNAHGLFGTYKGKLLGTFGCFSAASFHETKNLICGEGGVLFVNDPTYVARAEIIREKGTNRSKFFRGEVDKYTWVDVGSSYLPSDILAAFLYAQLESWQNIQETRSRVWNYYYSQLENWASSFGARLPVIPKHCGPSFHNFFLLMPTVTERDALIQHLRQNGIQALFHYVPLHLSPMGRGFGFRSGDCPVSEDISSRLIRLPFYYGLSYSDQETIVSTIKTFERSLRKAA